tara:strand:- start:978 stop:1313 length:336 start_codon:yes stop_codon:yes gene_type:complete
MDAENDEQLKFRLKTIIRKVLEGQFLPKYSNAGFDLSMVKFIFEAYIGTAAGTKSKSELVLTIAKKISEEENALYFELTGQKKFKLPEPKTPVRKSKRGGGKNRCAFIDMC